MHLKRIEPIVEISSILVWQLLLVLMVAVGTEVFYFGFSSVMAGGVIVCVSTWHIYRSVNDAEGDRGKLLRLATFRFVVMLFLLGVCIFLVSLHPILIVVGMATAYVALYARSLVLILKKVKGDSLG